MAVAEPWEEIEFTRLEEGGSEFIPADCLTMNTAADGFLVSAFAREVLAPVLKESGAFWPVRVLGLPYWWLNCMALAEVMDRENTDADWSVVEGAWGSFSWITTTRRLAFHASSLKRAPLLFRIPEYPQGVLFARDELRAVVAAHGLTGFQFDLVWSTDEGGVLHPAGVGFGRMFESVSLSDVERRREIARDILAKRAV